MNTWTIYPHSYCPEALFFNEVFADATEFAAKVVSVGTDTVSLDSLYYILANKYAWSRTRYMDEVAFILAIKRELQITWPSYLKRKDLMDDIYLLQLADLQLQIQTMRDTDTTNVNTNINNTVNANNSPVTNASTVAITNKSNIQIANTGSDESYFNENYKQLSNKLNSLLSQYDVINSDYLIEIYRKVDPLFRVIL